MAIYAFGSNGAGQLGIGHRDDVPVPSKHVPPQEVCEATDVPLLVTAGGNHTLMLLSSGRVSITGSKQEILGEKHTPGSMILSHTVKLCSATWNACVLCTKQDSIFTYGKGNKGELGRGLNIIEAHSLGLAVDISSLVPDGVSVIDLASGVQHSVLVLSNGQAIGWGNGRKGQLGHPFEMAWEPRKIEGVDFKVRRAVCGREFTYLVGEPGEGRHAILGSDKWGVRSTAPEAIPFWKDIGASWGSIFVLQDSGDVRAWGRNDHGQLPPRNLPKIKKMAVGSEHVIMLTVDGQVLACGWGEHGNCGLMAIDHGQTRNVYHTIDIPDGRKNQILGVGAGCATSWIWSRETSS